MAALNRKPRTHEYIADQDEFQNYKVRKGDNFATIARKYRTTVAFLRDINDYPRKKKLRVGRKILVPDRTPLVEKRPELVAKSKKSKASDKGDNPGVEHPTPANPAERRTVRRTTSAQTRWTRR